jgi:hypothetical protein
MRDRDLVVAYAMLQSSETADDNDAYILFRSAGEKGASFLIANLSSSDEALSIRIIQFLKRMLILDNLTHDEILEELFALIDGNASIGLRLAALETIICYLTYSENENVTKSLFPFLLNDTDIELVSRLLRYFGKNRIKAAIPYLEVLLSDSDEEIAWLARDTLADIKLPKGVMALRDWYVDDRDVASLAEQLRQKIEAEEALSASDKSS